MNKREKETLKEAIKELDSVRQLLRASTVSYARMQLRNIVLQLESMVEERGQA